MGELKFYIGDKEVNPPKEWRDIGIDAAWVNGSIQPAIATTDFEFNNQAANIILDHISNQSGGGIFEGLPFKIVASDSVDGATVVYDGILDFLNQFTVSHPNILTCGVTRPEDIDRIDRRLEALSFGYLKEKGVFSSKDYAKIPYVVQKVDNTWEIVQLSFMGVFIVKTVLDIIKDIEHILADLAGAFTTIPATVKAVVLVAYIAVIIITFLRWIKSVIEAIFPIPNVVRGMKLRTMLEKAFEYIGYSFESNISELDKLYYIPSRSRLERRKKDGIPSLGDYGYRCSELVNIVLEMFNAQLKVSGTTAYIYPQGDLFWTRDSTYILPDVLLEKYTYNINEAYASQIFSFETDISDAWTVEDFTGTNYQVDLNSTKNIPIRQRILKGFKEHRFNIALASRKGVLDNLDVAAKYLLGTQLGGMVNSRISKWAKVFSGTAFGKVLSVYNSGIGVMRVSDKYWGVPKLIVMDAGLAGIPKNHRDILGARALYNKYHRFNSFASPYTGQKVKYLNVTIPFGLKQFLQCQNNAYFRTIDGKVGRFERLEWRLGKDHAVVDFVVYEPYNKNLIETTFEG